MRLAAEILLLGLLDGCHPSRKIAGVCRYARWSKKPASILDRYELLFLTGFRFRAYSKMQMHSTGYNTDGITQTGCVYILCAPQVGGGVEDDILPHFLPYSHLPSQIKSRWMYTTRCANSPCKWPFIHSSMTGFNITEGQLPVA